MNAINDDLYRGVSAAAQQAAADADVRAVVLYGGERVFAAGADIKAMSRLTKETMIAWGRELTNSFTQVQRIPKPVIAAITGYALGGGYELALCADFRVLGASATIGQPEILLGVIPGAGGTQRLARLVGPARAKDLVFTGRHVDRKSTRLNSSHANNSYAVFCLKKKTRRSRCTSPRPLRASRRSRNARETPTSGAPRSSTPRSAPVELHSHPRCRRTRYSHRACA